MTRNISAISRREILGTTIGAGLVPVLMNAAHADTGGAGDQANVKLIGDFLKMWGAQDATGATLAAFMSDDCEFRSEDKPPTLGKAAVTAAFDGYLAKGVRYDIHIVSTFAKGPVVVNFRNEYAVTNGKRSDKAFPVVGVFVVRNGKVHEWRNFGVRTGESGHD